MHASKLKIYLELIRFNKPVGTVLLLSPTLWALFFSQKNYYKFNYKIFFIFMLGAFIMRSLGCIFNDIVDKNIDGKVNRTLNRPLAKGKLSVKQAIYFAFLFLAIALILVSQLNVFAIILSVVAFFIAIIYPLTKYFFKIPQLFLSIAFSMPCLIVYAAIQNNLPIDAWLLFFANFFWTMSYDSIYAISDIKDDLNLNVHSAPIFFGKYSKFFIFIFQILFLVSLIALHSYHGSKIKILYCLLLFSNLVIISFIDFITFVRQRHIFAFNLNMIIGLLTLLFLIY